MSFFRRFFGKTGWDTFPLQFITDLKRVIGEDGFQSLTHLSKKYRILKHPLFLHPEYFEMDEMTVLQLASFLTSMGNELGRHQHFSDAETAFRIALSIKQDHFAARCSLAVTLACTQRHEEAKREAVKALKDFDAFIERVRDREVPAEWKETPESQAEFRQTMQDIIAGNVPRKVIKPQQNRS